jgi:small subunit ribosomal protein S1
MAKKQVAEKELEATTAELQGADARLTEKKQLSQKLIRFLSNKSNHH